MYYLEVVSLILFVVLMTIGYKKNNRNIMLASSLCLLLGLAGPDFISGFKEGYSATEKVS
ncbi:hypothetical protein BK026_17100 [Alteromonas sp. V450]|uniref:hypothetical protein n=1 Tax=Alteromonas sp. V450 TaxID=1912139 RepID=UPI0008FF232C|nr:hypothetical protein [Alteromonas sp. V450]OJF70354.1 hypothetical protein BK026_17100 [Alteromonas sp. V450]